MWSMPGAARPSPARPGAAHRGLRCSPRTQRTVPLLARMTTLSVVIVPPDPHDILEVMGVGLRLGVNAGYMKFSRKQKWLPF